MTRRDQAGYIALLSVLVVGAAATAIALTLLVTGTDAQRGGLVSQQSAQARWLVNACAEEALQQIHDSSSYVGTNTLNFSTGSCSYIVTSTGANARTIAATASLDNVVRKVTVYVTIGSSSISITSWQEVS